MSSYQGGYLSVSNKDEQDDDDVISPTINACDDAVYLLTSGHCMKIYPVQDNGFLFTRTF